MTETKPHQGLTRRRMLAVCAASVAIAPGIAQAQSRHAVWRGIALGAQAEIQLIHTDEQRARDLLNECVIEIDRLEGMFSLYRPDSMLAQLNQAGVLDNPAHEFLELLSDALQFSSETDGAFDVTVQPLWSAFDGHFSTASADPGGPAPEQIRRALDVIDYRSIKMSSRQICFARRDMAITLNGIAQGFITDRISTLLNRNGFDNILVHMGETYGSGTRSDGTPWNVGIEAPGANRLLDKKINLRDQAIATSGGYGHVFAPGNQHHHLFDPRTGHSSNHFKSVTVTARRATTADALSTAFNAMPLDRIAMVLARRPDTAATIVTRDNTIIEL